MRDYERIGAQLQNDTCEVWMNYRCDIVIAARRVLSGWTLRLFRSLYCDGFSLWKTKKQLSLSWRAIDGLEREMEDVLGREFLRVGLFPYALYAVPTRAEIPQAGGERSELFEAREAS